MREELERRIRSAAQESFSRSGGPGGQNVNKVNTQVTVHVPLAELELSDEEAQRVHEVLAGRISSDDELVIQCSDTRSQAQNREIALDRAVALIDEAIRPRKPRRPTKPGRASREARLERKRRRAEKKELRRPPEA
ncbi:MAG: alternative ribosome rescue aminoacyl-tRNA hydrolase ArfB [Spirochaetota bacterium]